MLVYLFQKWCLEIHPQFKSVKIIICRNTVAMHLPKAAVWTLRDGVLVTPNIIYSAPKLEDPGGWFLFRIKIEYWVFAKKLPLAFQKVLPLQLQHHRPRVPETTTRDSTTRMGSESSSPFCLYDLKKPQRNSHEWSWCHRLYQSESDYAFTWETCYLVPRNLTAKYQKLPWFKRELYTFSILIIMFLFVSSR